MITPLPAGSTFAGYQVDAVLARGGMGVVYLATELRPRRRIALKLIAPALAADPAYRERFLREVDALAALEHPNVVPIHAAGEWDEQLYLAMRYLDGPDLAEVVRTRGPLPPAEALALIAPIADALDVAHARGIVHRDVTPSNIRLDARGIPYLTDFGLTKRAATAAQPALTLGPMGTPAYMAPEQFSADAAAPAPDPALAPRADVYALGCVLVTLLTGVPPYPRDTYEAALWAHVHADPPSIAERVPGLPPTIDPVIARALAKDPAVRFASPGALVAAARAALAPVAGGIAAVPASTTAVTMAAMAGTAGAATPSGSAAAAPPPPPRRRRSPLATAARALVLLVLVVAAGSGIGAGLLVAGSVGVGPGASPAPTGAALATPAPTERPTPTPTPSPTPTPTPSPTPTPEPTPRLGAPEDVARLRAWLPRALRNECVSASLRSRDEVAALRCTARDVQLVRYVLFGSADRMSVRWDAFVAQAEVSPDGRCAMGEEAAGTWGDEGIFGIFGETRGLLACTVEADGEARVDWTTVDAPIWGTLWRDDEDIAAAYATWSEGKLELLREPR
ncbi:MAG: serine/threonine protein kinase [Chloroflexi bacterium]|nr:serine/threonine protein kinase [Chloroflexota bacterium]